MNDLVRSIAKNKAQEAHLTMFTLRHPTFTTLGHPEYGDIPYLIPVELRAIAVEAGASKVDVRLIDIEMPHHLAFFPLDRIREIEDEEVRDELEEKWTKALGMLDKYGEEHPPVVVMTCWGSLKWNGNVVSICEHVLSRDYRNSNTKPLIYLVGGGKKNRLSNCVAELNQTLHS